MLDEFACTGELKRRRGELVEELHGSANVLSPLYEERERLEGEIGELSQLQQELGIKSGIMSGDEELKWTRASSFVGLAEKVEYQLTLASINVPGGEIRPETVTDPESMTDLERLFGQAVPALDPDGVVCRELLKEWQAHIKTVLGEIEQARQKIASAVAALASNTKGIQQTWKESHAAHEKALMETLRAAGVDSPQELITRVTEVRRRIDAIQKHKQPRLEAVKAQILTIEAARVKSLAELQAVGTELTQRRVDKARELTNALGGKIKVEVQRNADRREYLHKLVEICAALASRESQIKSRDAQLALVVNKLTPIELARALKANGEHQLADLPEVSVPLVACCGITENTQSFLCRIADDILRLNELETVAAPDVLRILVQRRGETTFAELTTGLSQGEQSAAILTLALQTRSIPLILDQPEDELGYSYVVHLIVPKILQAKFARQIMIVTHNANIPVLGDADFVIKMENRPRTEGGRTCVVAECGGFESAAVTKALIELEGGSRAFNFRRYRYAMPRNCVWPEKWNWDVQ